MILAVSEVGLMLTDRHNAFTSREALLSDILHRSSPFYLLHPPLDILVLNENGRWLQSAQTWWLGQLDLILEEC